MLSCHIIAAHWDVNLGNGGVPHLKSAKRFSFEELKKYTNNFSEGNSIGSGGYGKVDFDCLSSLLLILFNNHISLYNLDRILFFFGDMRPQNKFKLLVFKENILLKTNFSTFSEYLWTILSGTQISICEHLFRFIRVLFPLGK